MMTEVVAALIWDKGRFMICQHPANKARPLLRVFVGGKVEPGEAKEPALIRECYEEIDIAIEVGEKRSGLNNYDLVIRSDCGGIDRAAFCICNSWGEG